MVKVTFTHPIQIIQDGLKAVALFTYAQKIVDKNNVIVIDGNVVDVSLVKKVEWEN